MPGDARTDQKEITCPKCDSKDISFSKKQQLYVCLDCSHKFTIEKKFSPLRIFLSYGHDEYAALAEQLKVDLQNRGHEVWFDLDRLKPGGDWETYIEEGFEWVSEVPGNGRFILLMTPHSVRRPDGYCLNEVTRALERKLPVIPVMVVWSESPLSICRIQWLDMRDCIPFQEREVRYETKLTRLVEALEQDRIDFEGTQARLFQRLRPLPFEGDILPHLTRFTGRQWVFGRIDAWLADPSASRVFWITGKPGVGKTAIASWLCTHRREVAAFHLCRHGHVEKSDPRRAVLSIAYQISSQLPGYRERLNSLDLDQIVSEDNVRTLFDNLIVQPLSANFSKPGRMIVILIDALDEATEKAKNELASFIASEFDKTPEWIRLIITSRPEPEVIHPLQALTPYVLDASAPENENDLRTYLLRELQPFAGGKEPQPYVIDTIISLSEGIFLYVEWIRRELSLGRLSLNRLEEFPKGLGGVYVQFIERQFSDIDKFKTVYRPVLELMAAAREPLEMDYIASIFGWSVYDKEEILDAFGSLFSLSDNKIQPFHKSIMDWLNDPARSGPYFTSAQEGHKRLADYGWLEYQSGVAHMSDYSLIHLPAHLSLLVGRKEDLRKLLLDFDWLQAKLAATDVNSLIADYDYLSDDSDLRLVQGAIRLSANVLAHDKKQLAGQLLSRLLSFHESKIQSMLDRARGWDGGVWLCPLNAGMTPPGGVLIRTLEGHTKSVNAVAVTPDSMRVISASGDNTLKVWAVETGEQLRTLEGHTDPVMAVVVTQDGRRAISASGDNTLKVWDVETGEQLRTLEGHTKLVSAVALTQDGKRAISASGDKTLKVWDLETGKQLQTLEGHSQSVNAVALTPDGTRAVSASGDKTLRVWGMETGKQLQTLEGHSQSVNTVAVTLDGRYAISASYDETMRVWDIETGNQLQTLEGHTDRVNAVAVTQEGGYAISASRDRTLRVWDIGTGEQLRTLEGHTDSVTAVAVTRDGRYAISASYDKTLRVWDMGAGKQPRTTKEHTGSVRAVALTQDGKSAVSASGDKTLKVWDMETGNQLQTLEGHTDRVNAVAVTQERGYAISASDDKTLIVWDIETGEQLRTLEGHTNSVTAVAVTRDGRYAISASYDETLKVWDMGTGEQLRTIMRDSRPVNAVALTHDDRHAISASYGKTLKVWDLETGKQLHTTMKGHSQSVHAVALTQDDRYAISASHDRTLRVWEMETGKPLRTLEGHTDWVRAVALTRDDRYAISASYDDTLKVWDLKTGKVIASLTGDSDFMTCAVSSDGRTIVAGERLGRVHFLRLQGV